MNWGKKIISIFPNPATDPYTNTDQIKMLAENQTKLDQVLTNAGYDVGHVISFEGGSGGGVAAIREHQTEGLGGFCRQCSGRAGFAGSSG